MTFKDLSESVAYKRIGLFDSGVGGLSVLRRLLKAYPEASYFYLGDTARLPYGNRSQAEIQGFVAEIVTYLDNYNLDTIVMACNTSAALGLDTALDTATKKGISVLNLIGPTAAKLSGYERVGILATIATATSRAFEHALAAEGFTGTALSVACPQLVPLIESGRLGDPDIEKQLDMVLREYLRAVAGSQVIVLGCTHFPFIADRIEQLLRTTLKNLFPPAVRLVDPADILVEHMQTEHFTLHANKNLSQADFSRAGLDQTKFAQVSITLDFSPASNICVEATGDAQAFAQSAALCLGPAKNNADYNLNRLLAASVRQVRQVSLSQAPSLANLSAHHQRHHYSSEFSGDNRAVNVFSES